MYLPILGEISDIFLTVCIVLIAFYLYVTSYHGVWERVGVPGPTPWPVIDHLPDLKNGVNPAIDKWHEKYGRTFGIYGFRPRTATLVTTDIHLLNHILVKDFSNFTDRYVFPVTRSIMVNGLFFINGGIWKRNRHLMTPMFTGSKLKSAMHFANETAADLTKLMKKHKADDKLLPAKTLAAKYASDVIAKSGFGVDGHAVNSEDSKFFYHINRFFHLESPSQIMYLMVCLIFPFLAKPLLKMFKFIDAIYPEAEEYFTDLAESARKRKLEERSKEGNLTKPKDMMDYLLELEADDKKSPKDDDRTMSKTEIIGNSVLLLFAAYETTSSALMAILYCLARHQDVQDKVMAEIDTVLAGRTEPNYELLSELKYTDQMIKEALRMYPPTTNFQRLTLETKSYEGITIPKGTNIYVPLQKVLSDPEYWPEPQKFDPDRFGPARKSDLDSVAYLVFGHGPRHCIGQRLALLELKVALCHLLSDLRFVQTEHTEPKLGEDAVWEMQGRNDFPIPSKPIMLDVKLREK